jgi:Co/Zn/Cd efflux system component
MARSKSLRRVLWAVLLINAGLFAGEYAAGLWAGSTALQGDSLDSLADALVYALSLGVLGKSLKARAGAALLKGALQAIFGGAVIADVVLTLVAGAVPSTHVMGLAASVALVGNLACFLLLMRYRSDDINMRSVWLCSRNDVIGNAGVLLVTALIVATGWAWLDLVFGVLLAALFLRTAVQVIADAWPQYRQPPAQLFSD